ncbi:MAG: dihydropteroate synthase [Bacteroidales bacterium]|nr:dihydropteroate synthase [Bacteroidales bacterium]
MEKIGSLFQGRGTLLSNGKLIDISKPLIMGIINVTNDSFFGGSQFRIKSRIARRAEQILLEGGIIIDIGACSTRPGSMPVDEATEIKRLTRALSVIRKKFPDATISIDTFRANVAKAMHTNFGIDIVNDISAGEMDSNMFRTVADLKLVYVLMHMKGSPRDMQEDPRYDNEITKELFGFFTKKIEMLKLLGVKDIIIDPGFGFGKNLDHNYTLLKNLDSFKVFELPILAGISRKSMIYKQLNTCPNKALNGTSILNTIAILNGASILRVHDVKEAAEVIKLTEFYIGQPKV